MSGSKNKFILLISLKMSLYGKYLLDCERAHVSEIYVYFCQDMGVDEPEFVELASQIEELEQKLFTHPLHKVCESAPSLPSFSRLHLVQFV